MNINVEWQDETYMLDLLYKPGLVSIDMPQLTEQVLHTIIENLTPRPVIGNSDALRMAIIEVCYDAEIDEVVTITAANGKLRLTRKD